MNKANECTCPSGDGSLVHPCPAHPAVEQAGGDERAVDGKPRATKCPDCGEGDLMPGDLCACGYETDPAAGYACSECDGSGDGYVGEVCRECDGSGWFVTPEQARAALAQPSPVRSSLLINGYQLRAALDFIAPDGTAEQLKSEACIEWRQQDADFLEAGLYAFCAEYPEEGGVLLDEEPTTAQPSPLQSDQAEAERPALWAVHAQGPDELYAAFSREDAEKHAAELNALPIPEGIAVGAVVVPSPWPAVQHWQYLAEQEQDHKNEIAGRLRQLERICEGLPQDAIDGGWTVQGIRGYAKRLEDQLKAALARVAELERQEPVALANRGLHAFWVKWTEAAAGLIERMLEYATRPAGDVPQAEQAEAERPEGPTEDELEAAGLGYPLHKEEAVKLWYSGFRSEVITVLEAWEAIGHDIGMNPDKGELLDSLRYMLEKCEAHDAALAEVAGLRSLLNSLLCYVERDIDRMRSDRDKSDNKEIYDRSISLAMERLKAAQNAVFTTEPGCDTAVELAAQTTQAQHCVPELLVRAEDFVSGKEVPQAWLDVQAERRRQITAEGWTPEHDDLYCAAELPRAAAAYILNGANDEAPAIWPFSAKWWKPRDARSNYVRASALILAEIERLDRAAPGKEGNDD
ncbi:TPA: hypothetical protein ACL1ZF_004946 [Pseudomonas aeruginosa]